MINTRPFNTWDALKILALALMLIDHMGHFFFPHELWIRAIGRGAMPIFLFLTGFAASYRLRWNVVVLGVALTLYNFIIAGHFQPLNILLTIVCCRLILEKREAPERRIKKPFEWYGGAVACIISMVAIQYGSLALLIALCGYMKRFAADYTLRQRQIFWLLSFITCGAAQAAIADFSVSDTVLMTAVLISTALLLWRMEIRPIHTSPIIATAGKWVARNMAYLYAGHLALLMWLTGVPF
jgi:hypothetical protein